MGYFSDNKKMYVPLSIDTVEARRSNYFLSNTKMLIAFFAFIPLFLLLTPMINAEVGIIPIVVVTVVYMIGYVYVIRFKVLEEKRLRNMVRELDDNRVSGVDHFWGIDKVGESGDDDGMIYYSYKGNAKGTTKGLVVMVDRGSMVAVPEGHYEDYRRVKEKFLRALHINKFYPLYLEMQKRPEMQESLVEYADILSGIDNEYHQRLLKLNLIINTKYTMGERQRYVEYYVIKRDNFNKNFRRIVETIIDDTFGQSSYVSEVKILDKREADEVFKNYLMVDTLDSNNIRKAVDVEPFENFAKVHRLVDSEGKEVPIQLLDEMDLDRFGGRSFDKEVQELERRDKQNDERRKRLRESEIGDLNRKRNRELMTQEEYLAEKARIEDKYSKENFGKDTNKDNKRDQERKEREKQREERRSKREPVQKEIPEYDLNNEEEESYVYGDESLDDLIKKELEKQKKQDSVFGKYKK